MIDLDDVAPAGVRPREWQVGAPVLGYKPPVSDSPDLQRVLAVARRPPPTEGTPELAALAVRVTRKLRNYTAPPCACVATFKRPCVLELREIQAAALWEIYRTDGLLAPIAVGAGKTFINLLAPMVLRECKTALLLVPAQLMSQLVRDYRMLLAHWHVPSLVMHDSTGWSNIIPSTPVLHVLPYSLLQRPERSAWIADLNPDVIISDECDKLRNPDTATGSRYVRQFEERGGRAISSSGSMSEASVKDYWHLAMIALGERSPLPHDPEIVKEWASAIDADASPPAPPGALEALCRPGEHVRSGYHRRLVETPGVIVTTASPVAGIPLEIVDREIVAPRAIERALADLRATWCRPDGEELIDIFAMKRCARELAAGFYYRWRFPRGESVEAIEAWLEARKMWHCELRDKLKDRREHLDSPLLCARAARRAWGDEPITTAGDFEIEAESDAPDEDVARKRRKVGANAHLPTWKADHWPAWRDLRDSVQPETEAVRLDDYLARDCATWARANRGIVWYTHSAFGHWVAELSGLPLHGGGPGAGKRLEDWIGSGAPSSIIVSAKSHGRGRDGLQYVYADQIVPNPETSSAWWEQLLGRLHRVGQKAPAVYARLYRHTPELRDAVNKALRRADYVGATLGGIQKITAAGLVELDPEYPEELGEDD